MTLDNILEEVKQANNIVLLTHESPDGDAIGSVLAIKLALEHFGKTADAIIPEYSRIFKFLPRTDEILEESEIENYDLAIALDCATAKRLAGVEYFENAHKTIVIDHHGSNNMFGDLNYVNPVSPACCEILAGIFDYYNIEISQDIGKCLLTGIITDTGGFKYPSTTAETFEFTAELLRKGINVSDIYKRVMQTVSFAHFELAKRVMDRLEIIEDGKVAFTYIDKEDEQEVNAEPGDHEGLVEIGRNIEGIEVSIFLRQSEEGKEEYKASLRSSDYVNVSDVCIMFGGGGHPRAAGATISGSIEEVKQKLLKEIKKVL